MKIGYYFCLLFLLFLSCDGAQTTRNNTTVGKGLDSSLKWIDYRQGELPPEGYYNALDSTIKKWGIRYERIEGGCEIIPGEKQRYERDNEKYFELLEKQFGMDWRRRFDQEVSLLDSVLNNSVQTGLDHSTRIGIEVKRIDALKLKTKSYPYSNKCGVMKATIVIYSENNIVKKITDIGFGDDDRAASSWTYAYYYENGLLIFSHEMRRYHNNETNKEDLDEIRQYYAGNHLVMQIENGKMAYQKAISIATNDTRYQLKELRRASDIDKIYKCPDL
jgi:hypothetical protein